MYDLEVEGEVLQQLWQEIKDTKVFDWKTKDKKHDPYDIKSFGDELNQVIKPTTREQGSVMMFDEEPAVETTVNREVKKWSEKK